MLQFLSSVFGKPSAEPLRVKAEFAPKLEVLFKPKPIKVLYGGRGAGRSWGCARAMLLKGARRPMRILCAREIQNSISESVHKLLKDQISLLGLDAFYEVQVSKIIGRFADGRETTIVFEGIRNNTRKIKSYEGIDLCWVEEGNSVSKASWEVLLPTLFRKPETELWITFNPELEDDYTYQRFVVGANPDDTDVVFMNWHDNPWFPEGQRKQMLDLQKRDPDAWMNVWEGHPRRALAGAVYGKELRRAEEEGRICSVPYDRSVPVDVFFDLGKADFTAMWFAQFVAMQVRVLKYFFDQQEDIDHYLREIQSSGFVIGTIWLPHDAKAKRLGSKRTIEEIARRAGSWTVKIVPKLALNDGINAARILFPRCFFDKSGCADGLQALRHYKFKVVESKDENGVTTHLSANPDHNWASHGADAWRYLAVALVEPQAKRAERKRHDDPRKSWREKVAGLGWMGL